MLSLIDVVTVNTNSLVKVPSLKLWLKHRNRQVSRKRVLFHSSGRLKGSMAIEGSLVLPLFLFFMMTILLSLEMVRFQSNVQEALYQAGNESAFTGYFKKNVGEQITDPESRIREYIEEQVYPYLCVAGKKEGIKIENLSTIEENGKIHIKVSYQMKPFVSWLPMGDLCFEDEIYSHAWTGYSGRELSHGKSGEYTYVFVTETGSRYHLSRECNYLRVQVRSVDYHILPTIRNEAGEKYYACERCHPGKEGTVFLSTDGNRYHGSADCASLRRTVRLILLEDAIGYSPCSKCAR